MENTCTEITDTYQMWPTPRTQLAGNWTLLARCNIHVYYWHNPTSIINQSLCADYTLNTSQPKSQQSCVCFY